jgi:RNA polymerase sigma-70 factor (ECF subfamily)
MTKLSSKTEDQLVRLCKKESTVAFEELIQRNHDYIIGWIRKFAKGDNNLVDEIYQMALIKAWRKIKTFKQNCKFATWVNTIARNCFYDLYRLNTNSKFVNVDNYEILHNDLFSYTPRASIKIEKEDQMGEHKKVLNKIFSKLKKEHAEVLKLYHYDDLPYVEISKKIGKPVGTVMSRLFYARKNASKIIERMKLKGYVENFVE